MVEILAKPATPPGAKPDEKTESGGSEKPAAVSGTRPARRKIGWKIILIVVGGILFLLTILLTSVAGPRGPTGPVVRPVEGPTPTMVPRPTVPEFPLGNPSVYANDPQILQLEGVLKNYERQLESVDFREQDLDPPELLIGVNFQDTRK